ncbi:MAG: metalloregulator ArsR/SmtB family transcription factor [Polyangiaceae bacterium]|nr:metalloregulator ArsR/SmtB family transcription factor [Polyangiaceae bacterium]
MLSTDPANERWQLYRVLAEPVRLRLLALAEAEELSVGELTELLDEGQPNVSRHAGALRQAGLLAERRQGTRVFLRVAHRTAADPVVADALATGRRLVEHDGSLARVEDVVRGRDSHGREFFARHTTGEEPTTVASAVPAYLFALAPALEHRGRVIDAGTGDGALLDVLAPLFVEVLAIDRSEAQLGRARDRVVARGYQNVELMCAELDAAEVAARADGGVDLVTSSRMLHHAPRPGETLAAIARLLRPGGQVVVIDYLRHDDERLGEQQADVWLGFEPAELTALAAAAGFVQPMTRRIPASHLGEGTDTHLGWQVLTARRALASGEAPHTAPQARRRTQQAAK